MVKKRKLNREEVAVTQRNIKYIEKEIFCKTFELKKVELKLKHWDAIEGQKNKEIDVMFTEISEKLKKLCEKSEKTKFNLYQIEACTYDIEHFKDLKSYVLINLDKEKRSLIQKSKILKSEILENSEIISISNDQIKNGVISKQK